jgi:uncharacterized membrane protein
MKSTEQRYSTHVSVPADEGIRVDEAVTIDRPIAEVYSFWSRLENLPRFMRHVESVVPLDEVHSHWRVKTIGGKVVQWDAEIIEKRENEMISWRSVPGADVDNAGSVWFTPVPGGNGTMVRVSLKYVPPAGKAGALIAKLFRSDAETEIEQDLQSLKCFLETGQMPAEKNPRGWQQIAVQITRKSVQAADKCARENAWTAITCAAMTFCVLGFLAGQSRK